MKTRGGNLSHQREATPLYYTSAEIKKEEAHTFESEGR